VPEEPDEDGEIDGRCEEVGEPHHRDEVEKRQMELVEEEEVSQVTDRQVERGRIGDEGLCEQVRNRIDPPPDGDLKDDRDQHEDWSNPTIKTQ
jgi:hypothetical protein